jgi:MoxR-like ATPase
LDRRAAKVATTLPLAALAQARTEAAALPVPGQVLRALTDLRRELAKKSIVASDRRWVQSLGALRAHAYLAGRDAVSEEDLPFLEHVLWRDPAERPQIRGTIRELLVGYEDEIRVLLYQSRELREYALRPWDTGELRSRAALEAHAKIRNILARVDGILSQARRGGRPIGRVEALREEIAAIEQEMGAKL